MWKRLVVSCLELFDLRLSLGGNCKTVMIATMNPEEEQIGVSDHLLLTTVRSHAVLIVLRRNPYPHAGSRNVWRP